ncbi:MAG: hypothetical protein U5K75_02240 [Ahrensia sp.]|nr:hypothetical protein [Ahrensia sp.]
MQNKDAISFNHWSLRVGRPNVQTRVTAPYFGEIVTADDDCAGIAILF